MHYNQECQLQLQLYFILQPDNNTWHIMKSNIHTYNEGHAHGVITWSKYITLMISLVVETNICTFIYKSCLHGKVDSFSYFQRLKYHFTEETKLHLRVYFYILSYRYKYLEFQTY